MSITTTQRNAMSLSELVTLAKSVGAGDERLRAKAVMLGEIRKARDANESRKLNMLNELYDLLWPDGTATEALAETLAGKNKP